MRPSFVAFVGAGSIPNQNDFAWNLPLNMLQCGNQIFAIDRTFKMPFVDFAGKSECNRCRDGTPFLCHSAVNGTLASTSPSGRQKFLKGKAKFIPKHDFCAEPLRLFLSLANLVPTMPSPILLPARPLAVKAFVG